MANAEEQLIEKVLTNKKSKRKLSIDSDETFDDDDEDSSDVTSKEKIIEPTVPLDENDLKWAESYIEEQQTQLILSLLNDDGEKREENPIDEAEDFKSPRPSLSTLGLGTLKEKTKNYFEDFHRFRTVAIDERFNNSSRSTSRFRFSRLETTDRFDQRRIRFDRYR